MMSPERQMQLMAYADGELEGAERAEVEGWLRTDPDAARFVTDLAVLGDFVTLGRPPLEVDLADAIVAAAAREPKVVPLARGKELRSRRLVVGGGVVAALALAASLFLFLRPKDEEPLAGGVPLPTAPAPAPSGTGVDVNLHETPGQSVGVFYNETTTSVTVWVDENGAK